MEPTIVVLLSSTFLSLTLSATFSFAVIGDPHVGPQDHTPKYESAVAKVNEVASYFGIEFVFIVGDITGAATAPSYSTLRDASTLFDVPYYQVLGNHDISDKSGDATFYLRFGAALESDLDVADYTGASVVNGTQFHNYVLTKNNVVFIVLDLVSREYGDPTPTFHNFTDGTWQWLRSRLSDLSVSPGWSSIDRLFIVSHYPWILRTESPTPLDATPTRGSQDVFSSDQRDSIVALFREFQVPPAVLWGSIAGHMHAENYAEDAFAGDPEYVNIRDFAAVGNLNEMGVAVFQLEDGVVTAVTIVDEDWEIPPIEDSSVVFSMRLVVVFVILWVIL